MTDLLKVARLLEWARLWVPCEDCGSARPALAKGRHGAMPVRASLYAEKHRTWPICTHGFPYWENCVGKPVLPLCCFGAAR